MKKYIFMPILLLMTLNLCSNELAWVDEKVEAIKPSREGVSDSVIAKLKDPFIFYKGKKNFEPKSLYKIEASNKTVKSNYSKISGFKLDAIMNKSAFISGKWYKINERVGKYKLSKVNSKSIILTDKSKKIELTLSTKNKNLKMKK